MATGRREGCRLCLLPVGPSSGSAVELARQGGTPIAKIAQGLGISESCLRNWLHADAPGGDSGSSEKKVLARLRRRNGLLEQENEILRRAAAYFAREIVLPK